MGRTSELFAIAVLMTSHNRVEKTIACLTSIYLQNGLGADFTVSVFLADSHSIDGTREAIGEKFPQVHVLHVANDVFWGAGTRLAGLAAGLDFDYHMWLNDDVVLKPHALSSLIEVSRVRDAIAVGATVGADGVTSYGGLRAPATKPLSFALIGACDRTVSCQTMNGNIVLIPIAAVRLLGLVDLAFPHAMGDVDYGLRARRIGISIVQAGRFLGCCERDTPRLLEEQGPVRQLRYTADVRRLPVRPWWTLCARHGRPWTLIYFFKPYANAFMHGIRSKLVSRRGVSGRV